MVWWTSAFDHIRKIHIAEADTAIEHDNGLQLRLLRGCGYHRNISFRRYIDHVQIARKFAAAAETQATPDIIVAALPPIDLCLACADYGLRHRVPVVLDMRDMWPDIFAEAVPRPMRGLARLLLFPLVRQAQLACRRATAITGLTDQFVDWGVSRAGRIRRPLDHAFPIAYDDSPVPPEALMAALQFWRQHGVTPGDARRTICYFGNVSRQLDLHHVISAARATNSSGLPARFVLCGDGERLSDYRTSARALDNVLLPGWVDKAQIQALMRCSAAGLDPLPDRYDYLATINNKAVEYLSGGLPILSSPKRGVLHNLITQHQCGATYEAGDVMELTAVVTRLQRQRDWQQFLASNAHRLYRAQFLAQAVHSEMTNYLQEVINSPQEYRAGC